MMYSTDYLQESRKLWQVEDVVRELQARGFDATHRAVLEWIADGLLPHPRRHGRGRGRGVVYGWDDDRVIQQAVALCLALRYNRRVSNVVIPLWVLGCAIDLKQVRRSFVLKYDTRAHLDKLWQRYGREGDELEDVLSRLAVKYYRVWGRVIQDKHEAQKATEVMLNIIFNPRYPPGRALKLFARILKILRETRELLQRLSDYLSYPTLFKALTQAKDEDYLWARNVILRMYCLVKQAAQVGMPDKCDELRRLLEKHPEYVFALANVAGELFVPRLVKARLDGYEGALNRALAFVEQKLTRYASAFPNTTPNTPNMNQ